ncbi:MAG: serine--tRNA ligase [Proteobacteria bacterium]|nr:serine--tRNA ligase [Pseudomonadota bacterium]
MHDIRAIRANPDDFKRGISRRPAYAGEEGEKLAATILAKDEAYRAALTEKETLLARRNAASKEIGQAMAAKDAARAEALKAEVAAGKDRLAVLEGEAGALEGALRDILAAIPNIPLDQVPPGEDEHGNVQYRAHGAKPVLATNAPKEHYELGEALGMMDFETAAKLSGSRFVVLNRGLARLERALGQFMLDLHTGEHGYTEVNPPILVKDDAMFGTAQLPKFRDDQFMVMSEGTRNELLSDALGHVSPGDAQVFKEGLISLDKLVERTVARAPSREDRWLVPTAEVPLTNLVREKILSEEELPLRFTALTPCFRAEAGSAGRDTRGMLRQHQFNKVELVSITTPETSLAEHERMVTCAEEVLKRLGLHFRTMVLCTGDMGFASQKTYDIEVWLPGQNTYREISSCSVCGDFQARRMDARFRPAGEKNTRFVHTLNGSGVAVGRCLIAVMENYQNADGSITVPEVLAPYMGGVKKIERLS